MQQQEVLVRAVMAAVATVVVHVQAAAGPAAVAVVVTTVVAVVVLQAVAVVQAVAAEAATLPLVLQQQVQAQPRVMLPILNVVMLEMPVWEVRSAAVQPEASTVELSSVGNLSKTIYKIGFL
jgi:hypothetical protein